MPDSMPTPSPLQTDLYEFTMAQAYFHREMFAPATFSLFIRDYPTNRGYFVNAGLEDALTFLEEMRYSQSDLDGLHETGLFGDDFLHYLSSMVFSGDVRALAEGRLFFKDEPIVEVTAPIIEAQLAESLIINAINLQVILATKVSRCVQAAEGRNIVDFSLRRTQGGEAAMKLVRAGRIAGLSATSNVLAAGEFDLPASGTMAHSYVTSFESEREAFRTFAQLYGDNTVLLIDTYDTLAGAEKAVEIGKEMKGRGVSLRGVRLDSGDMVYLSREVRKMLDENGLSDVRVFASGGFDEYKIRDHLLAGAKIDGFGVGTKMGVSADAPYTDMAYKLVQYDGRPILKLSSGKKTLVCEKQVYRICTDDAMERDVIALHDEAYPRGEALLQRVVGQGKRLVEREPLTAARERLAAELAALPRAYKQIRDPEEYPVDVSERLEARQRETVQAVRKKELGES